MGREEGVVCKPVDVERQEYQNCPAFCPQGKMDWDQRAIVSNDPTFRGKGNRKEQGIWAGAPNIDHSQEFVRNDISEWLRWLRTEIGLDGWRIDYARGIDGRHIKHYVEQSNPWMCIGEYWDALDYDGTVPRHNQDAHRQRIIDWIDRAGSLSAAFDMTTKGILHAVFENGSDYWRLRDATGRAPGLMGWWPSRAVTFLENHDTGEPSSLASRPRSRSCPASPSLHRPSPSSSPPPPHHPPHRPPSLLLILSTPPFAGSTQGHWRFPEHGIEQGYAYILTHPGTPCVFYDHLHHSARPAIEKLLEIRSRQKLHCRSVLEILEANHHCYAAIVDGRVAVRLGDGQWQPDLGRFHFSASGHGWVVWEAN